jgi:co-chaperonin GroES (HSP10)
MRNEIIVDKLGKPLMNKVLVKVTDTFDEFKSKGGIDVINSVHEDSWNDSPGYNITEFVPRHGSVVDFPFKITHGSYDYETVNELCIGDEVWWSSISFKDHQPIVCGNDKYLLVDYHEILVVYNYRAFRNGNPVELFPVNGNVILKPVAREEKALDWVIRHRKTDLWEIYIKPYRLNKELNPLNEFKDVWEEGDIVYISVYDSPFKLEGDINRSLSEDLYVCPLRFVLCSKIKSNGWF